MRVAAIDIGTNSVHMLVVRVREDLSFEVIDREKAMVRLGAGGLDGQGTDRGRHDGRAAGAGEVQASGSGAQVDTVLAARNQRHARGTKRR
jgi:hypothetical protein